MLDPSRAGGIFRYDAKNLNAGETIWVDNDNQCHQVYDAPAVDAHYYAGVTYDFYKSKFGRLSYDNADSKIESIVHQSAGYNNAFWSVGAKKIYYGDGNGVKIRPLSGALDMVAHEFTHGVSSNEAGLIYENESRAISESLSDIFGTLAEFSFKPATVNWLIGEDVYKPATAGDPDHMDHKYLGTEDNGGVHWNSGILNKAAYLISEGGTHRGLTVAGIGKDKMGKIMYKVMTEYLYSNSDFMNFALSSKDAAKVLYGNNSPKYLAVRDAFVAVGILPKPLAVSLYKIKYALDLLYHP